MTEESNSTENNNIENTQKDKLKLWLPFTGLPLILAAILLIYLGKIDFFALLRIILIIVFGYIAAVLDIKNKKIPNRLVLVMLGVWAVTMATKLIIDTESAVAILQDALLGFAIGGGLFLLVYAISRKGLGGGDVKFMAAAGLYLGLSGTLSSMLYGTILAALTGIILLIMKKLGRKDPMPLAPFLYVGILITVFYR